MQVATISFKADMFTTSEVAFTLYGEVVKEGVITVTKVDKAAIEVACQMQGVSEFEIDNLILRRLEAQQERLEAQHQQYLRACDAVLDLADRHVKKGELDASNYYLRRYDIFWAKAQKFHELLLKNMRALFEARYGVTP